MTVFSMCLRDMYSVSRVTYCDITNLFATCLVRCKIQSTEKYSLVLATWDANACKVYIRVILSDARFNVARNMRMSFAAESTCSRMVYSICSKTYRGPHNREEQRRSRLVHRQHCRTCHVGIRIFTISIRGRLQ